VIPLNRIQKLPRHVADLIAAGEVVERPGSVVKELMENSIDAGASLLTVEIRNGGLTYVRVADNGCGMSAQDACAAFQRHATSKLRDERGLEAIGTLGFRGEALAAISAVSRIELLTREKGENEGTRVLVEGGEITECIPTGCPEGSSMTVKDLFFNTPARLKFMKNDRTEGMNVTSAVLRCALSHPEVSVKYIRDGREEFHTPGDGRVDSCIYDLLGRDFYTGMLKVESENEGIEVSGLISSPAYVKGTRASQYCFVNGRYIRSKTLQAAVEQAYRNRIFTGRFPACVLYLSMSNAAVDVNVHPAKTEVRFLNEKKVFDTVYYACLSALESEDAHAEITLGSTPEGEKPTPAGPPEIRVPRSRTYVTSRERQGAPTQYTAFTEKKAKAEPNKNFYKTMSTGTFFSQYGKGTFVSSITPGSETVSHRSVRDGSYPVYQTKLTMDSSEKSPSPAAPEKDYRVIGEAMNTYIIVEKGDTLVLIDKHAAHERMHFDRLKSEEERPAPQILVIPAVCSVGAEGAAVLLENSELLSSLGFLVESFGAANVIVREVPDDISQMDIQPMIDEICAALTASGGGDAPDLRDSIIASAACRAAIKAGKRSEPAELDKIAEAVMSGKVKYCPHGRPVAMELTRHMLDKNFRRV